MGDCYKFVVLGQSSVGKTSITVRFTRGEFREERVCTTIADCLSVKVKDTTLHIWDTAGEERYRSLASLYYRDAASAIIVYDVSERSSFESMQRWIDEVQEKADEDCVLFIVGNKIDKERVIGLDEARRFSLEKKALYAETSAKTGEGIEECFVAALRQVQRIGTRSMMRESYKVGIDKKDKKSCCYC